MLQQRGSLKLGFYVMLQQRGSLKLGFYVMLQQRGSLQLGCADYQLLIIIIKATKARIRTYIQDKESRL